MIGDKPRAAGEKIPRGPLSPVRDGGLLAVSTTS